MRPRTDDGSILAPFCAQPAKAGPERIDPNQEHEVRGEPLDYLAPRNESSQGPWSAKNFATGSELWSAQSSSKYRALSLNPNLATAWGFDGWMKMCFGEHNTAIEHEARAMRLSPLDPGRWAWHFHTALAHFFAGRYDEAASEAEASLREQPNHHGALRVVAASNALAGKMEQARQAMLRIRHLDPALRLSNLADTMPPLRRSEDCQSWAEGLRKAGLPE